MIVKSVKKKKINLHLVDFYAPTNDRVEQKDRLVIEIKERII